MATFNPFNPDGTWRREVNGKDLEDLGIKAKAAGEAAGAWAKAGKKTEEPWNQWQSQKSPEELEAFNQWKKAYVKFNDMTTKPGENWFKHTWDVSEVHEWAEEQADDYTSKMDYEERLAFREYNKSMNFLTYEQYQMAWSLKGRAEWWANKSRPDAWKELLKQAERNRQQQKQESYWDRQGRAHYGKAWDDFFNKQQRGGKQLTEELARQLILSNLDKFDVHYAEYWQRQRRMQMNEAKSKIGQLSIVSQRTTAEQFKLKMWQSPGSTSSEVDRMYSQVYGESLPVEISDRFAKLLMSPLFQWNC